MLESYRDLTDEQLIAALKNSGDPDGKIMDYILDKYKPLVRKKANAVFLIGGETDDLIQEGMIGLFKAVQDYDPKEGASFSSFTMIRKKHLFFISQNCVLRDSYTRQLRRRTGKNMRRSIPMFLSTQKTVKTDILWRKR